MNRLLEYVQGRFVELDRLLRGDATRVDALESSPATGHSLQVSARGLAAIAVLLAMFYGACMGSYAWLKQTPADLNDPYGPALQFVASTVKTPALFLLTLVVTLPSLYVSNALVGSRLTLLGMTRLLVASIAVNIAVLASLGTIVLFFSLTTTNHPFIVLMNVAAFTVAGVLGLMFLLQTLHRITSASVAETPPPAAGEPPTAAADGLEPPTGPEQPLEPGALDMPAGQSLGAPTRLVFRCWIVLFSLVGAQMGWVLRPFIGSPELPFSWFRDRGSNFFAAVFGALRQLLFG